MAEIRKQVTVRLDSKLVVKLDKDCEALGIKRPEYFTNVLDRQLNYSGSIKQQLEKLKGSLKRTRELKASVEGSLAGAAGLVDQLEIDLNASQALAETQLAEIEKERKRADEAEAKLANAQMNIDDLDRQKSQISRQFEDVVKIKNNLEADLNASKAVAETQLTKLEEERKRADAAEANVAELENQKKEIDEERNSVVKQRDKFRQTHEESAQRFEKLKEDIRKTQQQGFWGRLFCPKRVNVAAYDPVNVDEPTSLKIGG